MVIRRHSFLILLLTILSTSFIHAQPIGNEWIDYTQDYYKIRIHEDGVYRIEPSVLSAAGIAVSGINPSNIRIYARGNEVPLFVYGGNDGSFDSGDYLLFFAEANTGWFDEYLYENPGDHLNRSTSLFTDTAVYFLTWNSNPGAARYSVLSDFNFSSYTPAPYFFSDKRYEYPVTYYAGEPMGTGTTAIEYIEGEGFFDAAIPKGGTRSKTLPNPGLVTSGPSAYVRTGIVSASNFAGVTTDSLNRDHHLRISFGNILIDTLFEGYTTTTFSRYVAASSLGSTQTSFSFNTVDDLGAGADRNAIAFIDFSYPRSYALGSVNQLRMRLPAKGTKTLMDISGINLSAGDSVIIIDSGNHKLIRTQVSGSLVRGLAPASATSYSVFLCKASSYHNVTSIEAVSSTARFERYPGIQPVDFLIVTHPLLMNGPGSVADYASYRNSMGLVTQVANIEEMYDQYCYGIRKHPLAIRNLVRDYLMNSPFPPDYLFLVGKSYKAPEYRQNAQYFEETLVPTFGYPPSDIIFSSGISGTGFAPAMATGRLSARTLDHVDLYLDKVMDYEAAQANPQEWMKKVLHFGGGSNVNEQNQLKSYLKNFENIIEDTLFGAYVQTFLKSSTDPIQINQSSYLKQEIDNGISMMTFYGHAAGVGFDISIDKPSEYNNTGKYPFLLANSCFAGDLFVPLGPGGIGSSSEEFVLIRDKGTIAYLASVTAAGTGSLNQYSTELIRQISYKNYGEPIGFQIRSALQHFEIYQTYLEDLALDMTLHGDPAIRINYSEKPDYVATQGSIFFEPAIVTTELTEFTAKVVSANIGRAVDDTMFVALNVRRPDGSSESFLQRIPATRYRDTLSFVIPVKPGRDVGMHYFNINLDLYNTIHEGNESNNTLMPEVALTIRSANILPTLPYNFAVVPSAPELFASSIDPFAPSRTYLWDLDTTDTFNSPLKLSTQQTGPGGIFNWQPSLPISADSMVYYWRVSPDTSGGIDPAWKTYSFQIIGGAKGWAQSHIFQFEPDVYEFVSFNRSLRTLEFVNSIRSLSVQTGYYPHIPWPEEWYRLDGVIRGAWNCAYLGHAIKIAVFDPVSGDPWESYEVANGLGPFGELHCQPYTVNGFDFYTDTAAWRAKIVAMLNAVPDSFMVMVMSHRDTYVEDWEEPVYQAFESIGSLHIRTLQNERPYIILGRKGDPIGSAKEVIADSISEIITLKDSLVTRWDKGFVLSTEIGPARSWTSLHWKTSSQDPVPKDLIRLHVIGYQGNGQADTLIRNLPPDSADITSLYKRIDAADYPYIRLMAVMKDDSFSTPALIDRWQVLFEPVAETAIDPATNFSFTRDTLLEGEELELVISTRNIGLVDFDDSLRVRYWIFDADKKLVPISQKNLGMHPAGQVKSDTLRYSSNGLPGDNILWVEFNPADSLSGKHFVNEYSFLNNLAEIPFHVSSDKVNPLLDITFDGVHILDGEIVSAKPLIRMALNDENPFVAIDDTALFKVLLQYPNEGSPRRIFFNSSGIEQMLFFPGSLPENEASIEYNPELSTDGVYTLTVQAQDAAGNESGQVDFKIRFEVVNHMTITEVLNWPNPFSTSTRFVFTLTGSEIPDQFRIQILTITGQVVREIDADELGPIHIGRNISEFAWDGTDTYGDPLANGVYLYRVITRFEGEEIEKRSNEASKYFKKGFGKMYLMR